MPSLALYSKWRPLTFDDVIGQEFIIQTLQNAIITGRVGHAYLFSGPRGTGKTSMARIMAKALNCLSPDPQLRPCNTCDFCVAVNEGSYLDLVEIDAASHTSVDDVRDLREKIAFSPTSGGHKVYIIDEVHRFSGAAFDALLKTLEEPPPHAVFILATTEIHKVPQTIQSRCQRFDFKRIDLDQIISRLHQIAEYEGVTADWEALELIARNSAGAMRDSISLLDQLLPQRGNHLSLSKVQSVIGTTASGFTGDLINCLIMGDSPQGLALINDAVNDGHDVRQITGQVIDHLRAIMLVMTGGLHIVSPELSQESLSLIQEQAKSYPRKALLTAINLFNEAYNERNQALSWFPQLPLEVAFLESLNAFLDEQNPPTLEISSSSPPARHPQAPANAASSPSVSDSQPGDSSAYAQISDNDNTDGIDSSAPLTYQEVATKWRQVGSIVKQFTNSGEAQGMANSATVLRVEGSTITLQVKSALLKEKFEKETNLDAITRAASRVLRQPVSLICVVHNQSPNQSQPDSDLNEDSVIAYAVKELGGRAKRQPRKKQDE